MRQFSITMDMQGAAFEPDAAPWEVARLLRRLADQIDDDADIPSHQSLYDVNGNHIGYAQSMEA